jgi:hypothetical protein
MSFLFLLSLQDSSIKVIRVPVSDQGCQELRIAREGQWSIDI